MNKEFTITGQINVKALELLAKHPERIRWTELKNMLEKTFPNFHPKTINGCVWKLVEKYPDQVYKPEKGLFRLKKIAK